MATAQGDNLKTYLIGHLGADADVLPALLELWPVAMKVFGDRSDAAAWFTVRALGLGARPVDVLRRSGSLKSCQNLLMRMHYGVYC